MSAVENKQVSADEDGMRLDRWFKKHYPNLGHGPLQKLLRKGQVRLDGARAKSNARVEEGQTIRIPPIQEADKTAAKKPSRKPVSDKDAALIQSLVIFEDDDLIALNKPAGLASQGGSKTTRHIDGMLDALVAPGAERPRLVHRLDKDTSGVLLLAKTRASAAYLGDALKHRETEKIYWTLVAGVPKMLKGKIDLPLIKDGGPGEEAVRPAGPKEKEAKRAVTYYQVMDKAALKLAWLAMKPETGRTHQLRVHATAIGHPIIGDGKYGGEEAFPESDLPKQLHLHARSIEVPRKGKPSLLVQADLPPHMQESWAYFGFDPNQLHEPFI